MKEIVTILANPVIAKLYKPSKSLKGIVADILAYQTQSRSDWIGWQSMFSMKYSTFPAGFVRMLTIRLQKDGYKVTTKIKEGPLPLGPLNPIVDSFPDDSRYDYQMGVVNRLVEMKRMIAQVATGGGKSRIYKLCQARLGLPSLFLTTRKGLMYQMAEDYEKTTGNRAGLMGDGQWTPNLTAANFAITDTISARLEQASIEKEVDKHVDRWHEKVENAIKRAMKKAGIPEVNTLVRVLPVDIKQKMDDIRAAVYEKYPLEREALSDKIQSKVDRQNERRPEMLSILDKIGFLCLEEAHEVSSEGFYQIANSCVNAHYRLALTATPFMKDDDHANMRLMAVTGPVGIRVSEKVLIERGILAKPYFKYIQTPQPSGMSRGSPWPRAYDRGILQNKPRNDAIIRECVRAKLYGLSCMVLVQRTKHGDDLKRLMTMHGLKTDFIRGQNSQEERQFSLNRLRSKKIDVLIGSTILDVGVDVPSVGLIVNAGGGKAEVNLRQRVGRGLRAKKDGPNVALIVDFHDRWNNHLLKHSKERRRIIETTPGFQENIVTEFDYEALGFKISS